VCQARATALFKESSESNVSFPLGPTALDPVGEGKGKRVI
jgi:hypothetical protein